MTRNVFTYGSLMFDDVWTRVVAGDYRSIAATLAGHARFRVADADYPGMVTHADGRVDGMLYLDVDEADLARLDRFEGDDYDRASVALECADGVVRDGETYLYRLHERLLGSPWEPQAFAIDRFIATYCVGKFHP